MMRKRKLTKPAGLLLPEQSYNQLIQLANYMGLSVSEAVRNIVEHCLSQMEDEGEQDTEKLI